MESVENYYRKRIKYTEYYFKLWENVWSHLASSMWDKEASSAFNGSVTHNSLKCCSSL